MAGLNRELQASSLLECIVAAVILLATFMITMETLTRVTLTGDDPSENVSMELAARQCRRDRKSTRLNSSHITRSRMPSSA